MVVYIFLTGFLISIVSILALRSRTLTLNREYNRIPVYIMVYDDKA